MKYRVTGTLSVEVVTVVEADSIEEAIQKANALEDYSEKQLNHGNSEEGWTYNDGFSIDAYDAEEA